MKIINRIFVTIFLLVVIFIARDDISNVYKKGIKYAENKIGEIRFNYFKKDVISLKDNTASTDSQNSPEYLGSIETPGPLKVFNDLISIDKNKIKLSQKNVIVLTNKNRTDNGNLPPLKENSKLDFSAEKKLQDMFAKQYFEHVSPSGVGIADLGSQVSYEYITIGENLAMGNFESDKALLDAWMNSPGHRANILNKHYTEIGVAVGKGTYEGKSVWIAVQHFGLPKSFCPTINEALHGSISIDQEGIKSMESELNIRHKHIEDKAIYEGLTTDEQIAKYNDLINVHNQLIKNIKEKIDKYNNQVRDFNTCIAQNI